MGPFGQNFIWSSNSGILSSFLKHIFTFFIRLFLWANLWFVVKKRTQLEGVLHLILKVFFISLFFSTACRMEIVRTPFLFLKTLTIFFAESAEYTLFFLNTHAQCKKYEYFLNPSCSHNKNSVRAMLLLRINKFI